MNKYLSIVKKAIQDKDLGLITYDELGDIILGDNNYYSSENIRKFYYVAKKVFDKIDESNTPSDEKTIKQLEELKYEIIKERKKIQTVNIEYNANARHEARTELFHEMMIEAINKLKPIEIKKYKITSPIERTALLNISDTHYGSMVDLRAFNNEIVNKYNPDIFKARMWYLLSQIEQDLDYDKLVIFGLGDYIQGILRVSDIRKTHAGFTDCAIELAEFLSTWLDETQNRLQIPVEFQIVNGNHDNIKILTGKKGDFPEEDTTKIIYEFINLRLKNNENIKIVFTNGINFYSFYGYNVVGEHGECDLKKAIEYYEEYFGVSIDLLIAGHLHKSSQETIGIGYCGDRQVVRVPSIIGSCDYSKKLKKSSRAGAKFYVFDKNGINFEKTYYLN